MMDAQPQSSSRLVEVASLTPTNLETDPAVFSESGFSESISVADHRSSMSAMVFHFMAIK
jgi:hypothetical protein